LGDKERTFAALEETLGWRAGDADWDCPPGRQVEASTALEIE
jgi:hypothetical protein